MSKRFTDTEIWDKEWFMLLSPADKCAIRYVCDKCDYIGIWKPNFTLADFYIKEKIDWKLLPSKCNGNIEILPDGKWWIVDFVYFQYGQLSEDCPPHKRYISELKKRGLFLRVTKGFTKGLQTLEDKEEEEEEEKDKKGIVKGKKFIPPNLQQVKDYINQNSELSNVNAETFFKSFNDSGWIDSRGNPVLNWKMKIRTWSNFNQNGQIQNGKTKSQLAFEQILEDERNSNG
jgi:hypothetical protein